MKKVESEKWEGGWKGGKKLILSSFFFNAILLKITLLRFYFLTGEYFGVWYAALFGVRRGRYWGVWFSFLEELEVILGRFASGDFAKLHIYLIIDGPSGAC